jgi:hypothetical protein
VQAGEHRIDRINSVFVLGHRSFTKSISPHLLLLNHHQASLSSSVSLRVFHLLTLLDLLLLLSSAMAATPDAVVELVVVTTVHP